MGLLFMHYQKIDYHNYDFDHIIQKTNNFKNNFSSISSFNNLYSNLTKSNTLCGKRRIKKTNYSSITEIKQNLNLDIKVRDSGNILFPWNYVGYCGIAYRNQIMREYAILCGIVEPTNNVQLGGV